MPSYHVLFCSQCLSRVLKFNVPANTMLDGKLFQLFISVSNSYKKIFKKIKISKNCLCAGHPLVLVDSFSLNKEQFQDHKKQA